MKHILLLAFSAVLFLSCKPAFLNTFGRHYINKRYTGGSVLAKNYSAEIPFKIVNDQIILEVLANENSKDTLDFLFDTGSYSGVSLDVFEQFEGEYANLRMKSIGNNTINEETEVYSVSKLLIGDLVIEDFNLTIHEYKNKNIDGVIGADFMKGKVFTFDLPNNKIQISDVSPEKNINQSQYKIKRSWNKLYSSKMIVDDIKFKVYFDTESTGFLYLNDKYKSRGIQQSSYEMLTREADEYKIKIYTYIQTENLKLNNNKIENAILLKSSYQNSNVLGTKILMNNKVILDCINNELILELESNKIELNLEKFPTHSFAFGWLEGLKIIQKKVEVSTIDLEVLDEIIKINDHEIPKSKEGIKELLNNFKEEKIWHLKVKRGLRTFDVQAPPSIIKY